ncbi:MAG: hypothetical protein WKF85_06645 [Chitinophagaceae bacterium]
MRGKNAYDALFKTGENESRKYSKGRNNDLVIERNECLYGRFYFYSKMQRKRYEDVIELLSKEYFLSSSRIGVLIESAPKEDLRAFENWDVKDFERKYNFLNWKIN